MRLAWWFAVLAVSHAARADDVVARRYVAADVGGYAGAGVEGLNVTGFRVAAMTGFRISRWASVEGFFDGTFQTSPHLQPEEGAACSGLYTDQWHWETVGARLWVHLVHTREVDFSLAPPSLGLGPVFDAGRSTQPPGSQCYYAARDKSGVMLAIGLIRFGFELRGDRWFAFRVTAGAELDLGFDAGPGVLAIEASAGPVVRF